MFRKSKASVRELVPTRTQAFDAFDRSVLGLTICQCPKVLRNGLPQRPLQGEKCLIHFQHFLLVLLINGTFLFEKFFVFEGRPGLR